MSQLNVTNLSHESNGGDPNIILYPDGTTSIKGIQGGAVNPNLLDNPGFIVNQRDIVSGATGPGFMCDRWSCAFRDNLVIDTAFSGTDNVNSPGPLGSFTIASNQDSASATWWEQGIELNPAPVTANPTFRIGQTLTLSFWAARAVNDLDEFTVRLAYRKKTNVSQDEVIFFEDNATRTTDSIVAGGGTFYRYETTITIDSNPQSDHRVFYVGFAVKGGDRLSLPKLEIGPKATAWQAEKYTDEWTRCARYYWYWTGKKIIHPDVYAGSASDNRYKSVTFNFPTIMQRTPNTLTINSGSITDVTDQGCTYFENSPVNQTNFISNLQCSCEMTDFDTWRP